MVGRRLLRCSDFETEVCFGWCGTVGFRNECDTIVREIRAAATTLKNKAESAAKAVQATLEKAKEAAEGALNDLKDKATGWIADAKKDIGCAPAVAALMTSRPNDLPLKSGTPHAL